MTIEWVLILHVQRQNTLPTSKLKVTSTLVNEVAEVGKFLYHETQTLVAPVGLEFVESISIATYTLIVIRDETHLPSLYI